MGQFKPMVKMMTTEPTVELKLKKGGSAHKKMATKGEHGHKPMAHKMDGGIMGALAGATPVIAGRTAAPVARVPARPSLAARRRAMVARPVKEGGSMKEEGKKTVAFLEKKNAPKALVKEEKKEHGLKKGGKCYAEGGLAKSGIINTEDQGGEYRNTKVHTAKTDKSPAKTGDVKLGNAGGYKTGGVIKGNAGGYKTGGVALGNAGGFKKGGSSKKAFASGGSVNDEGKATSMPQGAKKPSSAVSIDRLSGTFKKGGDVSSKKLQSAFKKENAPAMKAAKKNTDEVYSPYQKKSKKFADGGMSFDESFQDPASQLREMQRMGRISEGERRMMMQNQSSQLGKMKGLGQISDAESRAIKTATPSKGSVTVRQTEVTKSPAKRYPSGLTDADIDKILSSKEFKESSSHFSDYKRGGKTKK